MKNNSNKPDKLKQVGYALDVYYVFNDFKSEIDSLIYSWNREVYWSAYFKMTIPFIMDSIEYKAVRSELKKSESL